MKLHSWTSRGMGHRGEKGRVCWLTGISTTHPARRDIIPAHLPAEGGCGDGYGCNVGLTGLAGEGMHMYKYVGCGIAGCGRGVVADGAYSDAVGCGFGCGWACFGPGPGTWPGGVGTGDWLAWLLCAFFVSVLGNMCIHMHPVTCLVGCSCAVTHCGDLEVGLNMGLGQA